MTLRRVVALLTVTLLTGATLMSCDTHSSVTNGYECDYEERDMADQEEDLICDSPYGAIDVEIPFVNLGGGAMLLPAMVSNYSYPTGSQYPSRASVVLGDGRIVQAKVEDPAKEVEGSGGAVRIGGRLVRRHNAYKVFRAPRRAPESLRPKTLPKTEKPSQPKDTKGVQKQNVPQEKPKTQDRKSVEKQSPLTEGRSNLEPSGAKKSTTDPSFGSKSNSSSSSKSQQQSSSSRRR